MYGYCDIGDGYYCELVVDCIFLVFVGVDCDGQFMFFEGFVCEVCVDIGQLDDQKQ